jgi:hypothetical protein
MTGELYGDFSRITFRRGSPISELLHQQGRVLLEADLNEQSAVVRDYLRTLAADIIGPHGGPDPDLDLTDAGFVVGPLMKAGKLSDLSLSAGRYYVRGLRCECPPDVTFHGLPGHSLSDPIPDATFLVVVEAWERSISSIVERGYRELALGMDGPDTVTRHRVVWRIRLVGSFDGGQTPVSAATTDDEFEAWATHREENRGRLRARAKRPAGVDDEPCITEPSAMYRGPENQLYRVEVHRGTDEGEPTFKWSRDNASAVFPIVERPSTVEVELATLGHGRADGLDIGDWVEIVDDDTAIIGRSAPLRQIVGIRPLDRLVTISDLPEGVDDVVFGPNPFLRRWDQPTRRLAVAGRPTLADDNALVIATLGPGDEAWLDLEDGIQVQFVSTDSNGDGAGFRRGDYWLIPARTATGDIEWPGEPNDPQAQAPFGVDIVYAPLALVDAGAIGATYRRSIVPIAKV